MTTFEEFKIADNENLWKTLNCVVAVAPYATAALTKATIFDAITKDIMTLPVGWKQLGLVTEDMFTFGRELETSEVRSGGEAEPGRTDVKSLTKSFSTTVQEVNKTTLELIKGMDLTAIVADLDGIVEIVEPDRPSLRYYRVAVFGADESSTGPRYRVRQFPRMRVTETGEETWQNEDSSHETELSFTAFKDSVLGTSTQEWLGGAGFDAAAAGFTA